MLSVGDCIDRYVIDGVLGEGGMGRVYRALDPRLGRRVALKVLLAEGSVVVRAEAAARMEREARAAAAFTHPNVVAIYDVGEKDGSPYIAMELVSGQTLRALTSPPATVSDAQKIRWLTDVARGLAAAHRAGLVHRDIKPDNVMVTSDGLVKILDFGIARRADVESTPVDSGAPTDAAALPSITADGHMIGTPQYMAPEQLRGEPLDGRCDEFSWGVMAWELLAGRSPWGSVTNPALLVTAVLMRPPPPLRDVAPGISAEVSDVVARALAKDRDARFATMDDLIAALERADPADGSLPSRDRLVATPAPATLDAAVATAPTVAAPMVASTPAPVSAAPPIVTGGRSPDSETPSPSRARSAILLMVGMTLVVIAAVGAWTFARRTTVGAPAAPTAQLLEPMGRATAAAAPPEDNLFPCRDTQRSVAPAVEACREDTIGWCATDGIQVACCPKEMIALSHDGTCGCPPGGLSVDSRLTKCPRSTMRDLPAESVQGVVRGAFPQLQKCYQAALKRNAEESGRFAVHFEIGPTGRVFFARIQDSALTDPDAQACVLQIVRALRFPAPAGGVLGVTYPIVFDPGT